MVPYWKSHQNWEWRSPSILSARKKYPRAKIPSGIKSNFWKSPPQCSMVDGIFSSGWWICLAKTRLFMLENTAVKNVAKAILANQKKGREKDFFWLMDETDTSQGFIYSVVSPQKHVELWNVGTFKLHGCSFIGSDRKRHPETAPTPFYENFKTQDTHVNHQGPDILVTYL